VSIKTPTCLLLDRNQDIDSFGYIAEDKYADLCMDGDNMDWYYFWRFKMHLHDTKVNISCCITTFILSVIFKNILLWFLKIIIKVERSSMDTLSISILNIDAKKRNVAFG
jgi:hypothetical protein